MDETGKQVWSAKYDAFGKATITTTNNMKFNLRADGQYEDDETGLYYNWNRYYNPSLGRYISSDPLGLMAGNNTYNYVNGNPINYTDPMGLYSTENVLNYYVGVGDGVTLGKYMTYRNNHPYYLGNTPYSPEYFAGYDLGSFLDKYIISEGVGELYKVPEVLYQFTTEELAGQNCLKYGKDVWGTGSYATRWNNKYVAKYFQQAKDVEGKITITDTSEFEATWFPGTYIKKTPSK
jgi:RHS repeat-associated protein